MCSSQIVWHSRVSGRLPTCECDVIENGVSVCPSFFFGFIAISIGCVRGGEAANSECATLFDQRDDLPKNRMAIAFCVHRRLKCVSQFRQALRNIQDALFDLRW